MRRAIAGLLLAAFAVVAGAQVPQPGFVPEDGLYWNPDEPGRGYSIEIQDRYAFVIAYVYSEQANSLVRDPAWYFAGAWVNDRFDFDSRLQVNTAGQCLGCPYVSPPTEPTPHQIRIRFQDATSALLTVDGKTIPIERFWFSPSISGLMEALLGQWKLVVDYTEALDGNFPFEGDIVVLNEMDTVEGTLEAVGYQPTTGLPAAAAYNEDESLYIWVIERTDGLFQAYYFYREAFGTNRFSGYAERFVVGNDLTGRGFPVDGFRTADRTFVEDQPIGKRASVSSHASNPHLSSRMAAPREPQIKPARLSSLNTMAQRLIERMNTPGDR